MMTMTPDRASRELDEDCSVERVAAAINGEDMIAQLDDLMRRATPLAERGDISPLAMVLIGTIARAYDDGMTLEEARLDHIRGGGSDERWDAALAQLAKHDLIPRSPK